MGYPGDHRSTEVYAPADATPPHEYEPVYDADADRWPAQPGPDTHHQPGHRGMPPPRRRRLPLLVGGAAMALVVLVGAGIGLSKLLGGDGESTHTGATSAASPPASQKPSPTVSGLPAGPLGAMLKSRATDPRALTLREVFRRKAFTVSGVHYVMTAWQATRACGRTVHGARLVSALHAGGCNQVLRGTFARADGTLAGTIGIANLKTARAASITAKLANAVKDTYLKPLPGRGTTKNLGNGIAFASAEARGHYVLLSWIQAPSGKSIPKSQRRAASGFGPNVIFGSKLGFALQYRGIAGKPYGR